MRVSCWASSPDAARVPSALVCVASIKGRTSRSRTKASTRDRACAKSPACQKLAMDWATSRMARSMTQAFQKTTTQFARDISSRTAMNLPTPSLCLWQTSASVDRKFNRIRPKDALINIKVGGWLCHFIPKCCLGGPDLRPFTWQRITVIPKRWPASRAICGGSEFAPM